jgi:hypothetical protein
VSIKKRSPISRQATCSYAFPVYWEPRLQSLLVKPLFDEILWVWRQAAVEVPRPKARTGLPPPHIGRGATLKGPAVNIDPLNLI